jgi:hypothetical protein
MTDNNADIHELERFVSEQTEIIKALNAELSPVYRRLDAIKFEIKSTHHTVRDHEAPKQYERGKRNHDGHQVIGFLGRTEIVDSVQFCGSSDDIIDEDGVVADRRVIGRFKTMRKTIVRRDHGEIEKRCDMFSELDRLSDAYGPMRERVRIVAIEIDGAKRTIARLIERQKESIKRLKAQREQQQKKPQMRLFAIKLEKT